MRILLPRVKNYNSLSFSPKRGFSFDKYSVSTVASRLLLFVVVVKTHFFLHVFRIRAIGRTKLRMTVLSSLSSVNRGCAYQYIGQSQNRLNISDWELAIIESIAKKSPLRLFCR